MDHARLPTCHGNGRGDFTSVGPRGEIQGRQVLPFSALGDDPDVPATPMSRRLTRRVTRVLVDLLIAVLVLVPLWWGYRWSSILVPGSGPQGQEFMLLLYIAYVLLMLMLAGCGGIRLVIVHDGLWSARLIGRSMLPVLAVVLAAALLPGIIDLGMRSTAFLMRGVAAARVGAGIGLMLWAVFDPWRP